MDYLPSPDVEGLRYVVYRDHLGNETVGVGHKVLPADKLREGQRIDDARVQSFLRADSTAALKAAMAQAEEAGITDPRFIVPLASVNFQLGPGWREKFPNAWRQIVSGDYVGAAGEVARGKDPKTPSSWMVQTPKRAEAFQGALRQLHPKPSDGD